MVLVKNMTSAASSVSATPTEQLYLSDTIKYLVEVKDSFHDRSQIPHRDQVYERVLAENPDDLQAVRFAKAFKAFLAEKKIHIDPNDMIMTPFTVRQFLWTPRGNMKPYWNFTIWKRIQ